MCGIAGFVGGGHSPEVSRDLLERMCDAIRHRGPDDAGYYVAPGAALGMRRLSIIDLAGGHQPIGNEDGSVQVVFNGEIYNYRELQQDLRRRGHELKTNTDTETIVHLYEEYGDDLARELRGMFAFAIWDSRRRRLLVCRDRLGIKPLYYWESDGGVAFASELKSLLQLPAFPRAIDEDAVADYLALGYIPEPASVFEGVRKLLPGHTLSWAAGEGIRIRSYWSPFRPENPSLHEQEAVEEIRRLLSEAVRYRLIADVPLGAFLSGGIDSSTVVAEMSRQMDRPVQTFSIGFEEEGFNEAPHAATVARAIGTDHTELIVRPEADELLEMIVGAFDEPFADSSAIPTYLVSQLARTKVTVALSGDGGDELFGGYTRYSQLGERDVRIPPSVRAILASFAKRLPQSAFGRNRLLELSRTREGRYAGMVALALHPSEGGIARADLAARRPDLDETLSRWFSRVPERDMQARAGFVDLISYLPGDILTKVDRMSMATSLEARVPLLDHHMVEFATTIPTRLKIRDATGKWIFRRAIEDLVPPSVLSGPKRGFSVPLRHWFRKELRYRVDALLEPSAAIHEYTDHESVNRVASEHQSGRRDHSALLWRLVVLDVWLRSLNRARSVARPSEGSVLLAR